MNATPINNKNIFIKFSHYGQFLRHIFYLEVAGKKPSIKSYKKKKPCEKGLIAFKNSSVRKVSI